MKLHLESDLSFDPATAWSIFESPEFEARLEDATDLVCTLLEERMEGAIKVRRLKYESKRDLPAIAGKALGMKRLTYEQHNRFDAEKSALSWKVVLPVLTDRVSVSGVTTILPTPTGARRVVDGDIEVRMRLVGGQIEKAVVAEFERGMVRAVDLVREIHREKSA